MAASASSLAHRASAAVQNKFSPAKATDVFFQLSTDVQTGDQLVWGSRTFTVQGTKRYDVPTVGHIQALCEENVT